MAARSKSNVISLTRVYDAPLQAVWDAWTIPEEVAQWWGPRGFTLTTHSHDLRTGGHWHYTMHGPDGTDYENTTQYLEVVPHAAHGLRPRRPQGSPAAVPRDGAVHRARRAHAARHEHGVRHARDRRRKCAASSRRPAARAPGIGWPSISASSCAGKEQFFIARSFDAAIERVYEMWTDPEHLAQWMPPTGRHHALPARGAACRRHLVLCDDGRRRPGMYGRVKYLDARKAGSHRLHAAVLRREGAGHPAAVLQGLAGNHAHHGRAGRRRTRSHARDGALGAARRNARRHRRVRQQRGSMTVGWTGSFDKLEALLG